MHRPPVDHIEKQTLSRPDAAPLRSSIDTATEPTDSLSVESSHVESHNVCNRQERNVE